MCVNLGLTVMADLFLASLSHSKLYMLAGVSMIRTLEISNCNIMVVTAQRHHVHTLNILDSLHASMKNAASTKTDLDKGQI